MKLKQLTFVFENQESLTIPANTVRHCYLTEIERIVEVHDRTSELMETLIANTAIIQLKPEANLVANEDEHFGEPFHLFDRLIDVKDVIIVELIDEEDNKQTYYIDWNEKASEYQNTYQSTAHLPGEDFILVVSKSQRAKQFA